jgi:glucose/arabinose dehydrogenase/type 1 glutamine amidotransferase/PKD repeat protein
MLRFLSTSRLLALARVFLFVMLVTSAPGIGRAQATSFKALIFSATAGYRHASITNGIQTIQMLAATNNFTVDATEDATRFTDANLAQYQVLIFLSTTGDVLTNAQQQAAFQHYIEAGGGWVGIHAAADTLHNWAWYGGLVGAYFVSHPAIQQATIKVADRVDPSTSMLPKRWVRTDEWYNFDINPRSSVHVLATIDENTYSGGTMGFDHPIAWSHFYDGGRAWYTESGHTPETYGEPLYQQHILGGILFAAGVKRADPGSTLDANYQKIILDSSPADPMELTVAGDGRVFYIERAGNVKIYKPQTSSIVLAGHINVETLIEDGLLGITLDNGFVTNNWLYLFYSPAGTNAEQHVSRFTLLGDQLDMSSEKVLLVIPTQRQECCHSAGSLFMYTNGDLYISAGDNSNPFASNGFDPIDEQPGRSPWDAQKSASNENDLRGKILRIHPQPDGTYTIPAGNLFPPGTPLTKPEIYIMGCRNPFRFEVDEATGWLYWGEVGPDANADVATRGPKGYDEWNQARAAGNFGWPYFVANNKAYVDYDFATGLSGAAFDPNAPVNDSPNNTGPTNLPPAQPAWMWYPYDNSVEFPELNGSGGRTAMGGPVYHFRTNVLNRTRLPAYFDQTLFIWEWSRDYIKEVKIDDDGSPLKINPFLPSFQFNRPMDLKIGPDGAIYMIEWGTGFGGNNPDARVEKIEYVGGNHPPVAIGTATPNNGSVPLTVQFSSLGTYDPDPSDTIGIAWSFFGDGITNSTLANPVFTYTNAGNYNAQLMVTDNQGNLTVANVPVSAGNNKAVVSILQPPNGTVFDWGKAMAYQVSAYDAEDGSTTNGTISCSDVVVAPLLGHNDHSHGQGQFHGCSGVFTAPLSTDADSDNLFFIMNASYTDRGAPNVLPLTSTTTYIFPPRHKQAEYCTTNATVALAPTADPAGGGLDIVNITNGSYISLWPVCLTNITGVTFRVACNGLGGRIETRADSATGPLLGAVFVPFTGGAYTNLTASVVDPGGTHTLYFVFRRNPGDVNLFVLNWLEFQGPALSLSPSPFGGVERNFPGIVQAEDFDEGGEGVAYHDTDNVNTGGQYRNTGVDIETCLDSGGGYDITSALAGEWLKYSVNVASAGLYTLSARIASASAGGAFHLEFNGVDKTGPILVPSTSGAQSWQSLNVNNVLLDAGPQVVTLVMDTNGPGGSVANFNYLQATVTQGNLPPSVTLTAPPDQATFSAPGPLVLRATGNDSDGTIARVDFFASGFLIGSATNAPYQVNWANIAAGNYLLTARATDNIGNTTTSAPRTVRVINGEAPFYGFPLTLPGVIQAEDFDGGGQGVAYFDTDASNNGGQYRATAVDIETTTDVGGGYNVGWTAATEWLKYTIYAQVDGVYTLQARVASSGDGGVFHIEFDGINKTGPLTNSNSGGWQTWRTLTVPNVGLTSGQHTMRLVMESNGANGTVGNYNWFALSAVSSNPAPTLIHRYSFNEPAGAATASDSVSHADGSLLGGAAVTGNGLLNLTGTSGYVDLPNGLVSVLTNATFEAWLTWNGGGNWQRVFDFGNNSNGENNQGTGLTYIMLTPKSAGGVVWSAATTNSGGGEIGVAWTNALPVGVRTHVALSYDFTAGTTLLYVNGQRVANGVAAIPLGAITDVNVWLGRSNWPDPYFNGQFDEFRIHNGALSDAAVAASYAAGPNFLPGEIPNLVLTNLGISLLLSWPTGASGFIPETASLLGPGAAWTAVTDVPIQQGDQLTLIVNPGDTVRFFRLRKAY